tara:strand:- start:3941 stop:4057 length:117 start_codon:yes stop_codon:yes gene_type:complete
LIKRRGRGGDKEEADRWSETKAEEEVRYGSRDKDRGER